MKIFVLLLVCATSAFAEDIEIDWSNVRPIQEYAWFWKDKPAVLKPFVLGESVVRHRTRIVNGEIATPHQFPYQAALLAQFPGGTSLCGGSLIHPRNILTAAHCVDQASTGTVILGAHNIRLVESNQQRINFARENLRIHQSWNPNLIQNDIAIIVLTSPANLNAQVAVVALPQNNNNLFENAAATVSGWGVFSDSIGVSSDVLRFYRGTIMTQTACGLRFPGVIQPSNICLSGANNGGACSGDSGGPLTTIANGVHTQVGVVSFGLALGCERTWPSVFARTGFYIQWIDQNLVR